ncbi:hypothetical protein [Tautonia marina]|uniref:hypothetical protein n=1 Tax=Tautonia marina TaxID=2653855 RepID=UPI001260AB56|nr:hypothetical protein [Tautonia marina]
MDAQATPQPIRTEDLDRLADGSLTANERRALLSRINTEPDGWRRCALAFLEAQAWRESFGPMTVQPAQSNPPILARPKASARSLLFPMTLAAGLIGTAFLLGRLTVGTGAIPAERVATVSGVERLRDPTEERGLKTDEIEATADRSPWEAEIQAIGYVSFPTDSNPEAPVFELPVLTGPGLDDHWLRDQPSFVPEEFRKSWEQLGYEVQSQRRLVSVQIDEEGRYLTIPVDEVLFRSKAQMTY